MLFKELKNKIKDEQKALAQEIRERKAGRKPYTETMNYFSNLTKLEYRKIDYRHKHIAYCMFFNNTDYEDIENTEKELNQYQIDKMIANWKVIVEVNDEAICAC